MDSNLSIEARDFLEQQEELVDVDRNVICEIFLEGPRYGGENLVADRAQLMEVMELFSVLIASPGV